MFKVRQDITGQTFGIYTVIEFSHHDRSTWWKVVCNECGITKLHNAQAIKRCPKRCTHQRKEKIKTATLRELRAFADKKTMIIDWKGQEYYWRDSAIYTTPPWEPVADSGPAFLRSLGMKAED